MFFNFGGIQNSPKCCVFNAEGLPAPTLPVIPGHNICLQAHMEAKVETKIVMCILKLWKYQPLIQDDARNPLQTKKRGGGGPVSVCVCVCHSVKQHNVANASVHMQAL